MPPLDAVAAAIRERLLAGRPAPLPGLGTLVRQHVPSRVEERPDGSRVLLPPGETIGLAPADEEAETLALAFARFRALSPDVAERAYSNAMDQIEARLAATGEVRLPGVGLLRRTSGGVVLGVEADLLSAVNRTYEGLGPVRTGPPSGAEPVHSAALPTAREESPPPPAPEPAAPYAPSDLPADDSDAWSGPRVERVPPSDWDEPAGLDEDPAPAETSAPEAGLEAPTEEIQAADAISEAPAPEPPPASDVLDAPPLWASDLGDELVDETPPDPGLEAPAEAPDPSDLPGLEAEPAPEPDAETAPPSAFVDDETLDDDLDEVLPAPFGSPDGPSLEDLLPPTAPEHEPAAGAPPSAPSDDAAWGDTWTASGFTDAPRGFGFDDDDEPPPEIEDADFDVVSPAPPPLAPDPEPEPGPFEAPPVVERVGPPSQLGVIGPPSAAPDVPSAPGAPTPSVQRPAPVEALSPDDAPAPEPEPPARKRRWGWLVALLLLVTLAAAAAVFWPQLEPTVDRIRTSIFGGSASPEEPPGLEPTTVEAAPAPYLPDSAGGVSAADPAAPQSDADDEFVPPVAEGPAVQELAAPGGASTARPEGAATPSASTAAPRAASRPAVNLAPPPDVAILPPRLAGLDDTDQAALAGRTPIDEAEAGWTFVVLSTPSRAEAEALRDRYRRSGYRADVLEASVGGRAMYRVAVGQFASRDDAVRLRDRLPPQAPMSTWALDLRTL